MKQDISMCYISGRYVNEIILLEERERMDRRTDRDKRILYYTRIKI